MFLFHFFNEFIYEDELIDEKISGDYFNKSHTVYSVNYENQTYNIVLGKTSEINRHMEPYWEDRPRAGERRKYLFFKLCSTVFNILSAAGQLSS